MRESLRPILADDLDVDELNEMLDRWCGRAPASETTELHPTIKDNMSSQRKNSCLHQTWGNQREAEGLNTKVRSLIARTEWGLLHKGHLGAGNFG